MDPVVRFLSNEEIKQRYPEENQSTRARLSREAVQKDYKIALVQHRLINFKSDYFDLYQISSGMLDSLIPEHCREFWCFTDLGETPQGKVYCAIREK